MDRSKKIVLTIGAIVLLVASLFSFSSMLPSSPAEGSAGYVFTLRGVSVQADCFAVSAQSWHPNAWQQLKDTGVNWIRVSGGMEGDVNHFNIINYPNEWAQNLNSFLTQASSYGIRVSFTSLGTIYGTLFGIVSPGIYDPSNTNTAYTPISKAEEMIDQLAGNNSLNHNFIGDPRVLGWVTSNEAYIGPLESSNPNYDGPFILRWNLQLLDYIRSKGGKAWISSPSVLRDSSDGYDFARTLPLIAGHVDFLEAHYYGETALLRYFRNIFGSYNWRGFQNYYRNLLVEEMVNVRGNFSIENVLLGEFGMWLGSGNDFGIKQSFTNQDRTDYYKAVLNAAQEANLKSVCQHYFFEEANTKSTNYGIVSFNSKSFFPNDAGVVLAEAYRAASVTLQAEPSSVTICSFVTLTGKVFQVQEGVSISILFKSTGREWSNLTTVISNSNGFFSYIWNCTSAGSYVVKAISQEYEIRPETESNIVAVTVNASPVAS